MQPPEYESILSNIEGVVKSDALSPFLKARLIQEAIAPAFIFDAYRDSQYCGEDLSHWFARLSMDVTGFRTAAAANVTMAVAYALSRRRNFLWFLHKMQELWSQTENRSREE